MQAMLAQVGINIVPRTVDTPTYNSTVYKQGGNASEFPLIFAGLQNGPDPSNINIGLNEKQIPPAGSNVMRIRMPEVSQALDAALDETDPAKRDARYQDVCKATNANLPGARCGSPTAMVWLPKAQGFRLDTCAGGRPLSGPSGKVVDSRITALHLQPDRADGVL